MRLSGSPILNMGWLSGLGFECTASLPNLSDAANILRCDQRGIDQARSKWQGIHTFESNVFASAGGASVHRGTTEQTGKFDAVEPGRNTKFKHENQLFVWGKRDGSDRSGRDQFRF